MTHPWNHRSGVYCCTTCEGTGLVPAHRKATVNDPYPESPCPDCDGPHNAECSVCGFDQYIRGYDCYACETIAGLFPNDLAAFDVDAFAAALKVALATAKADARRVVA